MVHSQKFSSQSLLLVAGCTVPLVKRIRYQLPLSGNGKCYSRDLYIAWPLLRDVTLKKKKQKKIEWLPLSVLLLFLFVVCLFVLFVS